MTPRGNNEGRVHDDDRIFLKNSFLFPPFLVSEEIFFIPSIFDSHQNPNQVLIILDRVQNPHDLFFIDFQLPILLSCQRIIRHGRQVKLEAHTGISTKRAD